MQFRAPEGMPLVDGPHSDDWPGLSWIEVLLFRAAVPPHRQAMLAEGEVFWICTWLTAVAVAKQDPDAAPTVHPANVNVPPLGLPALVGSGFPLLIGLHLIPPVVESWL